MNINYKIIETYPDKNQIVVRYYTDLVSEDDLAVYKEPDGSFTRCVTDTCIDIPLVEFNSAQVVERIQSACNKQFLEQQEMIKLANVGNVPQVTHNIQLIESLSGTSGVFSSTKVIPTSNQDWVNIRLEQLRSYRDNLIQEGCTPVTFEGTKYWFHSDTLSAIQQLGLLVGTVLAVMQGKPSSHVLHPTPWKTKGDVYVTLTVGLCLKLLEENAKQQGLIFQAYQSKEQLLLSSNNAKDFDVTTGWPETYKDTQ